MPKVPMRAQIRSGELRCSLFRNTHPASRMGDGELDATAIPSRLPRMPHSAAENRPFALPLQLCLEDAIRIYRTASGKGGFRP